MLFQEQQKNFHSNATRSVKVQFTLENRKQFAPMGTTDTLLNFNQMHPSYVFIYIFKRGHYEGIEEINEILTYTYIYIY